MAPLQEQLEDLSEALKAQFDSWPKNIQDLVTIEDHDGAHRFSFKEKTLSGMSLMGINLQGVNPTRGPSLLCPTARGQP